MAKYEIVIESVDSAIFRLGESYDITIHFKNENGTYATDQRLPHGHRQKAVISQLPYKIYFEFPESNFYISKIITCVTVSNSIMSETGEVEGELNVLEDRLEVLDAESIC